MSRALAFAVSLLSLACSSEPTKPEAKSDAVAPTSAQPPSPSPEPASPESPPRDVTPSGEVREVVVDGLKMSVPIEWVQAPGASSMRKAEFALPGPEGDASLVVYRFAGGAGSAEQNIERWRGQVELAVGTVAKTIALEVGGLKISGVDLRGRYAGQSMPGAPPQPPIDRARMLAVSIEGSGDPYYFKLIGAARSVDVWASAWDQLLASLSAG
jgi:hypothetical protein